MSKFQQIFRGLVAKRPVLFSLLCLLLLATGITGTWAWSSGRQSAINDGQVQTAKRTVQLLKLERDTEGNTTDIPVPGADFALYAITQQDPELYEQVILEDEALWTTDADGRISLALPPGRYFFREVRLPYGFAPDKDQQGQELRRYDFTVEPSTPNGSTVVTAYNRRLSGDLIIEKTLENDDGRELSELQRAQIFEFRVTFSDGGAHSYQINGEGEEHQLASGETLKLRHGQRAVFSALPVGLHYEVVEVGFQYGQADNTSGNIKHEAPSVVAFTNFGKTRTLDIEKEVINFDGSEVTEEQKLLEFEFTIQLTDVPEDTSFRYTTNRYQIDDDPENDDDIREGKLAHGDTIKLRHGEILTIHDLPIGTSYKVSESGREDFVSETEYVSGEIVADTASNRHLFRNIYQPEGQLPSFTALAFTKIVDSDDPADLKEYFEFEVTLEPHEGQTFQYRIIEGDEEGDLIDFVSGGIIRLRHGQKALFQDLPPGLTYRMREISTDPYIEALQEIKGHTVNVPKEEQVDKVHKTEKTVEIETNDDADDSDDSDEVAADNNDLHVVRFPNYRIPSERAKLILQKLVEGVGYDAGHEFVFDLYINDVKDREIRLRSGESSVPIELELGDRWRVVEHDSFDAGFSQQSIEYGTGSVEDEHRNRNIYVRQTNRYLRSSLSLSGQKTWEKPDSVQVPEQITVQLLQDDRVVRQTDVTGSEWTYRFENLPKFDEAGEEIDYRIREVPISGWQTQTKAGSIDLHNTWIPPVKAQLEIEKRLTGDPAPQDERFSFIMNPGGQTVHITNSGRVSFPQVSLDRAGTFEFMVHEKRGNTLGWTYDNAEYTWHVQVEQALDGKLSLGKQWLSKNGQAFEGLRPVFTNHFDKRALLGESLDIPVKKVWEHKELTPDLQPQSIIVQLFAGQEEVSRKQLSQASDWQAVFQDVPRFDAEGKEIVYQVKELAVNGYETKISGNARKGFTIRNTYVGMKQPPSQVPPADKPPTTERLPDVGDTLAVGAVLLGLIFLRVAYQLYKRSNS